jgi:hypothetical protein
MCRGRKAVKVAGRYGGYSLITDITGIATFRSSEAATVALKGEEMGIETP